MNFTIHHYRGRLCGLCEKSNTWRRPFCRWETLGGGYAVWQCSGCGHCTDDEEAATETPNPYRTVRVLA